MKEPTAAQEGLDLVVDGEVDETAVETLRQRALPPSEGDLREVGIQQVVSGLCLQVFVQLDIVQVELEDLVGLLDDEDVPLAMIKKCAAGPAIVPEPGNLPLPSPNNLLLLSPRNLLLLPEP